MHRMALGAALTLVACRPVATSRPIAPSPQEAENSAPAVAELPERPWVTRLVSPRASGPAALHYYGVSRVVYVYASGVRRDYTEDGLESGNDFATEGLATYDNSDLGALWLSRAQRVFRSPSIAGPLEPLGGLLAKSVAVTNTSGYACTPEKDLVRLSMSGAPDVTPLGRPCVSVVGDGDALFVEAPAGDWSKSEDEATSFAPSTDPSKSDWNYGWRHTQPPAEPDASRRTDWLLSTWRDASGRFYSIGEHGPFVYSDAVSWSKLSAPLGLSCTYAPSSSGLIASCAGRDGLSPAPRLLEYADGWSEVFAGSPGRTQAHATVTSVSRVDGSTVLNRACDRDWSVDATDPPLCVVERGARARTLRRWSVPDDPAQPECHEDDYDCVMSEYDPQTPPSLHGYQHPYLLVTPARAKMHVLDVRTGTLAFDSLQDCTNLRWVGPGWLRCAARAETPDNTLFRIDGDEAVRVSLPPGALSVAFADRQRGLAAGRTADALWTTSDGGATWDPAAVSIEGDPGHLRVDTAQCTNVVCSARPFVWADEAVLGTFALPEVRFFAPPGPPQKEGSR